jgi:hypothetical protein
MPESSGCFHEGEWGRWELEKKGNILPCYLLLSLNFFGSVHVLPPQL